MNSTPKFDRHNSISMKTHQPEMVDLRRPVLHSKEMRVAVVVARERTERKRRR